MIITSSHPAYLAIKDQIQYDVEEFWGLALSSNKRLIKARCLFRGTVDACLIHPRDIFRFGCLTNASSLIVAHNHPSDELLPSHADTVMTQRLVKAGKLMQIPIIDHLILGQNNYKSFFDECWKPFSKTETKLCRMIKSG